MLKRDQTWIRIMRATCNNKNMFYFIASESISPVPGAHFRLCNITLEHFLFRSNYTSIYSLYILFNSLTGLLFNLIVLHKNTNSIRRILKYVHA